MKSHQATTTYTTTIITIITIISMQLRTYQVPVGR